MKQYTTPDQTAKLIGLGFEKPRVAMPKLEWKDGVPQFHYTIGELIEMLPPKIDGRNLVIERYVELGQWLCCYEVCIGVYSMSHEFVDALYEMAIKLKEEGVI